MLEGLTPASSTLSAMLTSSCTWDGGMTRTSGERADSAGKNSADVVGVEVEMDGKM